MTAFAAPGKAVLWGEYAVLAGAPAMVMAVNRYARCDIAPGGTDWQCIARGLEGRVRVGLTDLEAGLIAWDGPAGVVAAAVQALGTAGLPAGATVRTDTAAFFEAGTKLGIGSSAAICTATCAAIAELLDRPLAFEAALSAHRSLQGGHGSGIDVAAAFHGGLVRFQQGSAARCGWPEGLLYQFVWTGHSARTTDHLERFRAWRAGADTTALTALCDASTRLFDEITMDSLEGYRQSLRRLDREANLGIYSGSHRELDELANDGQVVYKPCGAGGGDIGVAFSRDAGALRHFIDLAERRAFQSIVLEIADHGVQPAGQ